jgi:hypothetical protein
MNKCKYCLTDWFMSLVWPLVCGWYAINLFCLMPSNEKSSVRYLEMNLVSRSWMIFLGSPWSWMMWSLKICTNPCEVSSIWMGLNLTALVKQSTITRMVLYPWDSSNGPMISVKMTSHGRGWIEGVEWCLSSCPLGFGALTCLASPDICCYVLLEIRPPIISW